MGTADCSYICHCDDGSDYAVKDENAGKYIPHTEWFCKHLGDQVGIASPECRLVEVNGAVAFGSRWESSHQPENWWLRVQSGEIEKSRVAPVLSRIFAFDLFVQNEDRHAKNYIVRPQADDKLSFLAFDYSQAWMTTGWPLTAPPMNPTIVTCQNFKLINQILGGILDISEALFVLDNLYKTDAVRIEMIIDSHPSCWIDAGDKDRILTFWKDGEAQNRIDLIRKGFGNGDYI